MVMYCPPDNDKYLITISGKTYDYVERHSVRGDTAVPRTL